MTKIYLIYSDEFLGIQVIEFSTEREMNRWLAKNRDSVSLDDCRVYRGHLKNCTLEAGYHIKEAAS